MGRLNSEAEFGAEWGGGGGEAEWGRVGWVQQIEPRLSHTTKEDRFPDDLH
jgi:hypothetical protein